VSYGANALITEDESASLRTFVGTHPKQMHLTNTVDSIMKVYETIDKRSSEQGEISIC
jgi:hypothetical protein